MLTKNDLEQIDQLLQKRFAEFIETMFLPHVERTEAHIEQSEMQHREIKNEIVGMRKDINGLKDETAEIKDYIKDHETRIRKLEKTISSN